MTEMVGSWLHFTPRQPKRKRADVVCFYCHSKKIKCDLDSRRNEGHSKCSNCDEPGRECRLRPSRRGVRRQAAQRRDGAAETSAETSAQSPSSAPDPDVLLPNDIPDFSIDNDTTLSTAIVARPVEGDATQGIDVIHFGQAQDSPADSRTSRRPQASTSPGKGAGRSHSGDLDTGFLQVYGPENQFFAEQQELEANLEPKGSILDPIQQELQQSFAETYWEYCYAWCPVLDQRTLDEETTTSPLLANAVALAASHIQPPLVPHEGSSNYYRKAKAIFYNDQEPDNLTALKALSLFYWWAPQPPTTAHRNSSWWWTSTIIRTAQQMNIHREPPQGHPSRDRLDLSLRRRIWWTVFARERLTALCQSKPCIIDPDDCSIQEPQLSDFPPDPIFQKKGQIFIYWTRLCAIIGRIAKHLSRAAAGSGAAFPSHLRQELADWVHSLPAHLQLPIGSSRTEAFDRDVHQLYLPYLTTVIILHLERSAYDLPQVLPPAILAASCIARILRDILSRGNARYLMAITCWYSGTAFIALLQACRISRLAKEANEGMDVLEQTMKQLQKQWGSADVIARGFQRLRKTQALSGNAFGTGDIPSSAQTTKPSNPSITVDAGLGLTEAVGQMPHIVDDFDWTRLFPFVTPSTNGIAETLLNDYAQGTIPSPNFMLFHDNILNQYQDLLEPFTDYSFDFSDLAFQAGL